MILEYLKKKSVDKIQVSLKSDENNGYFLLYMKTIIHLFVMSRPVLLRMRNVSGKFVAEIKTYMLRSIIVFPQNRAIYVIGEKYCRSGHAADDSVAHAHCMLDT